MANWLGNLVDVVGTKARLPEFGLSEALSGNLFSNPGQASTVNTGRIKSVNEWAGGLLGVNSKSAGAQTAPQGGQVQGSSIQLPDGSLGQPPLGGGGGGGGGSAANLALLDQEYNNAYAELDRLGGENQARAGLASEQIGTQYGAQEGDLRATQGTQIGKLGDSATAVTGQATNAVNDARTAFNELQQRNNANLSASGLGSSSVAEAMGEVLGRNTFEALNNIQTNKDTVLQNIEKEKTTTNQYYDRKVNELKAAKTQALQEVQLNLQSAMGRINDAKATSTLQKAQARQQAIQTAQAAASKVNSQLEEYNTALNTWNNSKNQINQLSQQFAVGDIGQGDYVKALSQINQGLRQSGAGFQVNTAQYMNDLALPVTQRSGSYFTPLKVEDEEDAGLAGLGQ